MNTRTLSPTRRQAGFTVIELLTVVAVLGVLIAIAAPNFTPIMERWRVRTAAESMQGTLHYARSEAIKRGGLVVVQPMPVAGCLPGAWCSWQVSVNKNGSEEVLRKVENGSGVLGASIASKIAFTRWGQPEEGVRLQFLATKGAALSADSKRSRHTVCVLPSGIIKMRATPAPANSAVHDPDCT